MLDLSHRMELEWLARLFADIRTAAPQMKPLLVGALARDLLLHYAHDIKIERVTTDVDLAIAVADWPQFAASRDALIASGLFKPNRNTQHKLRHGTFGWLDLIPFGALESADGTIAWPPAGDEVMAVLGYAEANRAAIDIALPLGQTVRAISLPMLAVLKLLAWKDRHRFTQGKDAIDLALILRRYLDAGNVDRLYADFPHIVSIDFDFEPAGGWLLGRDVRSALLNHSERFDLMIHTLNNVLISELDPNGHSTLAPQLNPVDLDSALKLLRAFHAGLLGAENP